MTSTRLDFKRAPAPKALTPEQKRIWTEITSSLRPDFFIESDFILLEQYVTAVVAVQKARQVLEEQGEIVEGKINPYFTVLDHESKRCATLAIRLRLAPQSRYDRQVAGGKLRPSRRPPWEVENDPDKEALERYGLN